jgi:hypothetical protein
VQVRDAVGNGHDYSAAELDALGFPTQITVQSVSDVTDPALTAFSVSPTTVDVSTGAANVTANFSATDDLSGVVSIEAFIDSPSGQRTGGGGFPVASTSVSGSFNIQFPQFAEAGIWTVLSVQVRDAVGNAHDYSTAELAALGFATQVTVQSVSDVAAPVLTGFSISPTTVDVSAGPASLTANFSASDDVSGVVSIEAFIDSPSGQRTGGGSFPVASTNATGSFNITVPQFAEAGTWTVISVQVRDAVGNAHDYSASQLAALGFSNTLVVQNAVEVTVDIQPGESPNVLRCTDRKLVAVAIVTTPQFDALTVDHTTVTFGPGMATEAHVKAGVARRHEEDVDGDGDVDLVFHFSLEQAAIVCGSIQVELNGRTFGGAAIRGTDAIAFSE